MLVNPAPGALVRYPASRRAVEPGDDIDPTDPYWSRLIIDGDLIAAPAETPTPERPRRAGSSQEEAN
jgi:hypothetical protein